MGSRSKTGEEMMETEYQREYRMNHKKQKAAYLKQWQKDNVKKWNLYQKKYAANKRKNLE